ncbi:IBA57 family protein [Megaselia abdita]
MNVLHKIVRCQPLRTFTTSQPTNLFVEQLSERSLIRLQGEEVRPFLQGLITNDINHLHKGHPAVYTLFLNKQGRILYDAIIYSKSEDTLFLECDKESSSDLRRHLRMYRLRKKIDIDCLQGEFSPWVVFSPDSSDPIKVSNGGNFLYCQDPRLKDLGLRVILPKSSEAGVLKTLIPGQTLDQTTDNFDYKYHRIGLGVGEGVLDHLPGKAFPLESNADFLHGVSFQKGCYLGQELTARTYHTGVIRKRLLPLSFQKPLPDGEAKVVNVSGTSVGALRSKAGKRALGLMRVENVMKTPDILVDGEPGNVSIPDWWPKVLPKRVTLRE